MQARAEDDRHVHVSNPIAIGQVAAKQYDRIDLEGVLRIVVYRANPRQQLPNEAVGLNPSEPSPRFELQLLRLGGHCPVIGPILNQPSIGDQVRQKATNRIVVTSNPLTGGLHIEPLTSIESQNTTDLG